MILVSFSFVSKLLTAVLTYHLGWVATVAPGESKELKNQRYHCQPTVPVLLAGIPEVSSNFILFKNFN